MVEFASDSCYFSSRKLRKKQKAAQARNNTVEMTRKTGAGTCRTSKMRRKIKKYDTKMQQSEN